MKVAVVGPRQGADTEAVVQFCHELYGKNPEIVLISGGAKGADSVAEFTWHGLGGLVWSYRAKKEAEEAWYAEKWEYQKRGENKRFVLQAYPAWKDARSALFFRNMLMAEEADRLAAFLGPRSMGGAEWTAAYAKDIGRPVHIWRDGAWE